MSYRIAMIGACPFPVPQGSQVLLRDTAQLAAYLGHDVQLVTYGYGIADAVENTIPIHPSPRVPFATRTDAGPSLIKPLQDAVLAGVIHRMVRHEGVDILHAHNYEGLMAALLGGGKCPVVYHAHNAMGDELPHFASNRSRAQWMARSLGRWLDTTFPKRATHCIAPHARLADYLIQCGCRPDQVSVIPPAIDEQLLALPKQETGPPTVLYTGNIDAYQNLRFLERVLIRVRQSIPETRFILATPRRCVPPVDATLVYTPDYPRLCAVLSQDTVCACPRVAWSGYPIKLLNAMAAGIPVVACRSCAYPVQHEETGFIVDDNNEEQFAGALITLLNNSAQRHDFGKQAQAYALEHHNPANIARTLSDVYDRVLRK